MRIAVECYQAKGRYCAVAPVNGWYQQDCERVLWWLSSSPFLHSVVVCFLLSLAGFSGIITQTHFAACVCSGKDYIYSFPWLRTR